MVETPGDFPCEFHMRSLIYPDGDPIGLVHDNIGCLKNRITQEAKSGKIFVFQLRDLFLVRRISFQPGQWRDHGKEQKEFGMFLDVGLNKKGAVVR